MLIRIPAVLSPEVLEYVPRGRSYDMPMLFDTLIAGGHRVRSHHVSSYWLDIGRPADYEKINELVTIMEMVGDLE